MKSKLLSILPSVLTIAGTFLLGKNLFGTAIDESLWQELTGSALALVGIVVSIFDHTATEEMIQAGLRRSIEVVGALLVSSGKASQNTIQLLLSLVATLVPVVYGYFSRKKTRNLARGNLSVEDLKK